MMLHRKVHSDEYLGRLLITMVILILPFAVKCNDETKLRWQRSKYAQLSIGEAFSTLTHDEREFVYHLHRASWLGSFIIAAQTSAESPMLLLFVLKALQGSEHEFNDRLRAANFSDQETENFKDYACGLWINLANYREDNGRRFTPEPIDSSKLQQFVTLVWPNMSSDLTARVIDEMFSVEPAQLGFPPEGQTQFWRGLDRTKAESVQRFMEKNEIMAGNQMAVATSNSSGQFVELRFLSQANPDKAQSKEWMWQSLEAGRPWEEFTSISVHNGAYASFLELVSAEIDKALAVLRVDAPLRPSLELFAESLRDGDLSKHVESGKAWVRAPDLTVDTYMGFTENYRDPLKLQLEYQGMVFIRDPVSSPMFRKLSEMSAELLSRLPWSNDFEQELPWTTDDSSETNQTNRTKAKSFGSVMAAAFVSYYVPRGANLPNYESVKRVGGKNFNIVNSVMAKANLTRVAFLSPEDADLLERRYVDAFNIKLALHEQLGHDSGILLRKNKQGQANFNESLIDPTTGDKVAQWYTVGQSYYSKFGNIAAAFEETRANAIALYLACDKDVLTIFGHNSTDADEVCAAVFLNQIFTGLTALKSYDLETGWQSDHRQSDFALMRVLMEVLPDFVKIHEENENIRLTIDRSQIPEQTTAAVRDFVLHLQVYRATGNAIEGRKLFESYLAIDAYWLRLRAKVVNSEAEIPEPSFVQGNILRDPDVNPSDGSPFTWKDYPASCQGVLASLRDRFDADQIKAIESAVEKEVGA